MARKIFLFFICICLANYCPGQDSNAPKHKGQNAKSLNTNTQDSQYTGEWYIMYNEANRPYKGKGCVMQIEKQDDSFYISPVKECFPDCLPDEGNYSLDKNGNLVRGDFKISMKHGNLYYKKTGIVELGSMKSFYQADSFFLLGYTFLEEADSFETKTPKTELINKSIRYTDKALAINDKCVECFYNRSIAWYKISNLDSAVAALNKAKELDPEYAELPAAYHAIAYLYNTVAWEKYGKLKKYPQAITMIKKALSFDSSNADIWYNLGGAYYSNKQYAKAIPAFKKTLELDPEHKDAQPGLDAAEEKLNKK